MVFSCFMFSCSTPETFYVVDEALCIISYLSFLAGDISKVLSRNPERPKTEHQHANHKAVRNEPKPPFKTFQNSNERTFGPPRGRKRDSKRQPKLPQVEIQAKRNMGLIPSHLLRRSPSKHQGSKTPTSGSRSR